MVHWTVGRIFWVGVQWSWVRQNLRFMITLPWTPAKTPSDSEGAVMNHCRLLNIPVIIYSFPGRSCVVLRKWERVIIFKGCWVHMRVKLWIKNQHEVMKLFQCQLDFDVLHGYSINIKMNCFWGESFRFAHAAELILFSHCPLHSLMLHLRVHTRLHINPSQQ